MWVVPGGGIESLYEDAETGCEPKELSCIEPLLAAVIEDLGFGTETRLSLESRIADNKFNEPFQPTY